MPQIVRIHHIFHGWYGMLVDWAMLVCRYSDMRTQWINLANVQLYPSMCPSKSKFNLGNFTARNMVILVLPFQSCALYNFCYNSILLYNFGIPFALFAWNWRMFNEEDKMNGFSFSFQWFTIQTYFYINIVRLHPAVWNTFIMSAVKLCLDRFVCTDLFVY